jgi:hypothetical protein
MVARGVHMADASLESTQPLPLITIIALREHVTSHDRLRHTISVTHVPVQDSGTGSGSADVVRSFFAAIKALWFHHRVTSNTPADVSRASRRRHRCRCCFDRKESSQGKQTRWRQREARVRLP